MYWGLRNIEKEHCRECSRSGIRSAPNSECAKHNSENRYCNVCSEKLLVGDGCKTSCDHDWCNHEEKLPLRYQKVCKIAWMYNKDMRLIQAPYSCLEPFTDFCAVCGKLTINGTFLLRTDFTYRQGDCVMMKPQGECRTNLYACRVCTTKILTKELDFFVPALANLVMQYYLGYLTLHQTLVISEPQKNFVRKTTEEISEVNVEHCFYKTKTKRLLDFSEVHSDKKDNHSYHFTPFD
jgi:hypothetical protein